MLYNSDETQADPHYKHYGRGKDTEKDVVIIMTGMFD